MTVIDGIRTERRGPTLHLTLSAPERGNALGAEQLRALANAVEEAGRSSDDRVIILAAEGDAFCRGLDLESALPSEDEPSERARAAAALVRALARDLMTLATSRVPIIACVGGEVNGGGVGIAAACALVIATPAARFMLPELVVGMIPALITPLLRRRLGDARTRYMALSSRGVAGAEAHAFGLVDELSDDLDAACVRQVQRLLYSSPDAIAAYETYFDGENTALGDEMARATDALERWLATPGVIDAARDFAEGGRPQWFTRYRPQAAPAQESPRER
ncbi:enoyl-CoA hydratase/isomerase family protein [Haliangium ochraceum]|uniref:Enoyl-CoA hydratase n=1 Tax=Haliangium ochraceum (strain DSM 14365 / JCM 11303 / SMP-2) TaxID=502025 RepID=D0LS51_HALO1|nr:enoyl-CoA hydratase/isomerase family protein [Haliangium ochraceum]ACY13748.1 Enoyl-CoA hydratase/isomerase [Haliangium ochraceum DSM 14365]AMM72016.1 enoyl-CoA hydratase [Haliangium ochraceum DSM 14365]